MRMERGTWSDARLSDRFDQIDRRFDQVDARFDRVDSRLDRVDARLDGVHTELGELRTTVIRIGAGVGGGIIAGLLGVIAAILTHGA
jgi:tetrahydromethanopterin S-methyltransferase subunit G